MVRSIFSLCSIAVGLKKILAICLVLTIVYLVLSNFTIPSNWQTVYVSSSTQYRFSSSEAENGIQSRISDNNKSERTKINGDLNFDSENETNSFINSLIKSTIEMRQNNDAKRCPDIEHNSQLIGHLGQAPLLIEELEEWEVEKANPDLVPGGNWKPENCTPNYKVAIVIPYRDRKSHLIRLMDFLIPILKRQMLDFRFILTEQKGDDLFNKGRIMNAAFRFGYEQLKVDCLIFHDVDMFPQDDRTPYGCPGSEGPRHVGAFVSSLGYQLWYQEIVGGVLAINVEQYLAVNGFSNSYWGWGGEDDDMGKRILGHNLTISRPNSDFVRFTMLKHVKRKRLAPKLVYKLLEETEKRMDRDGVKETDKWRVEKVDVRPLFYHLLIDVGDPPSEWKS